MSSTLIGAVISALLIGVLLSVLGSGGSILTVPILLYVIGMTPNIAIASSLAVVGMISIFSAIRYIKSKQVSWQFVLLFGLPGMAGTYSGAWLGTQINATIQLGIFVALMIIAAVMMFKKSRNAHSVEQKSSALNEPPKTDSPALLPALSQGFAVGVVTGVVGVGGGFLIVPALVLLAKLPIVVAIGTSLIIITINSAVGFSKYYYVFSEQGILFDWVTIFILAAGGIIGSLLGGQISKRIPTALLQQIFAGFLIIMAGFIFTQSVL